MLNLNEVFLSGNRLRKSSGKIVKFSSAKKRRNWERVAQAYKHGWKGPAKESLMAHLRRIYEGGAGSGNFGHAGRAGEVGGSGEGEGGTAAVLLDFRKSGTKETESGGHKLMDKSFDTLPKEQQEALKNYTSNDGPGGSDLINAHAREGWKASDSPGVADRIKAIELLDRATSHMIKSDVIAYRNFGDDFGEDLAPGFTFTDKGFSSFSLAKESAQNVGEGYYTAVIHIPAGAKGMYIGNKGLYKYEYELLLHRGVTLRVDKVSRRTVYATVVSNQGSK
jgi:hypothetical protein